ncbi:MAG: sugar transferase, partial [Eubacteriales bacterium]|nr:sugar transferase [Eubacteriales bacterium]
GNLKRVSSYFMYISDMLAFLFAFLIAYAIRRMLPNLYVMPHIRVYLPFLFTTIGSYILVMTGLISGDNYILRRGRAEFLAVMKMLLPVFVLDVVLLFFSKTSDRYSRVFVALFFTIAFLLDCAFRIIVKKAILPKYRKSRGAEKIYLVTEKKRIDEFLEKLNDSRDWRFQIAGIVLVDAREDTIRVPGIPVIPWSSDILHILSLSETDSVLLGTDLVRNRKQWTEQLRDFGKTVYLSLDDFNLTDSTRMFDYLGECAVVSYLAPMPVRGKPIAAKRCLDILFALLFMPILVVFVILVGLADLLFSRGPLLVPVIRIGKSGRRFRQYRFRVLRMDAEARIQKQKSPYSPVGKVLRALRLDGMPMLYNILVGDMSVIGPRACSPDEFQGYNPKIIRNLCTRPGIMGLWTLHTYEEDGLFDENRYIHNWNLKFDFYILLRGILKILTFRYRRKMPESWMEEEAAFIQETLTFRAPMQYDHSTYSRKKTFGYMVYLGAKRLVDICGSLLALLLLSPVFLILMILIIGDDGGNPFYGHSRIGKGGKRIKVYKFRSMKQNTGNLEALLTAEQLEQYRREFKIDNDPRITGFGTFLRKSSLDELPQLLNILKGELSFVGPRPVVEEETRIYGEDVAKLLSVKPGLSGYWQAYARNNATYETGERQRMEMFYVDHQGPLLDIRILFRTVFAVFKQEGAQ